VAQDVDPQFKPQYHKKNSISKQLKKMLNIIFISN
jgi:hypothetical protein